MVADQQEPDWLVSLRQQQQGESPPRAEDQQEQMGQADIVADLQAQMGQADMQEQMGQADVLEDMREQMIQAEEEFEPEEKTSLLPNLEPWQRFVLVVLLFLNVALCGCMILVMTERVMFRF